MPANVPSGRTTPGNRNTTKCEKVGRDGNVKAYCVSETMIGFVSTGLEGRMRPNGGAADMDLLHRRRQVTKDKMWSKTASNARRREKKKI